jgi:hypothetical protein
MRSRILLLTGLAVASAMILPDFAFAQSSDVFGTLQTKSTDTFQNVRLILFVIAGLGICGMAGMAFFGRFQWSWAFSMGGGLVMLAAAGGVIYFATHSTGTLGSAGDATSQMQSTDSLK